MMETRKALISVWDKTGVLELAKGTRGTRIRNCFKLRNCKAP